MRLHCLKKYFCALSTPLKNRNHFTPRLQPCLPIQPVENVTRVDK